MGAEITPSLQFNKFLGDKVKIIVGLLAALVLCLVTIPAQAASFGLSPATVDYQITKGSSKTVEFTVVGYSGTVEISAESMPVSVSPMSVNAVAGSRITVTIKCNSDAIDGLYEGKIVFLAKSGTSVMSGIKVRCNLTVGGSSSPATYGEKTASSNIGGNDGGGNVVSTADSTFAPLTSSENMRNKEKGLLSSIQSQSPSGENKTEFNFVMFALIVVSGLLFIILLFIGFRWMQQRRRI